MTTATEAPAATRVASFNPEALYAAIDQCLAAAARDYSRPVLYGVYMRVIGELVTFTGADGFQLVSIDTTRAEDSGKWEIVLDRDGLKDALPALRAARKGERSVTISVNDAGTEARIETDAAAHAVRLVQGSYPKYDKLIPEAADVDGDLRFAMNPSMLGKLLTTISKHTKHERVPMPVRIQSEHPTAPVRFDWHSYGDEAAAWTARAIVMPMFVMWP